MTQCERELLIFMVNKYINTRNFNMNLIDGAKEIQNIAKLSIACDKDEQLFNLLLHHIDLYQIEEANRRRNLRYFLKQTIVDKFTKLCVALGYVNYGVIDVGGIVSYLDKSKEDTQNEIDKYFNNCLKEH